MALELTPEEWADIKRDFKKEAREVCYTCRELLDESQLVIEEVHPGDNLTPPDYDVFCPHCGDMYCPDKETFEEWLNRNE